jgi:4-hydroxybenzoate polyprenyltransferase
MGQTVHATDTVAPHAGEVAGARPSLPRALLAVSRPEFMPGGLFFIFSSAALATLSWSVLVDEIRLVLCGACVWYLSHLVGSQVNCLADVEIDVRDKAHLSRAVTRIGPRTLAAVIAGEAVATLALTVYMAVDAGRPVLPLLWLLGLALALAYSLEPVRLKRRGWLNPVSLVLMLYALPMAYGYVTLADHADAAAIVVLCATGLQMLALILLNPAADVETDRAAGIQTPCVRHGIAPVATLAAVAFAVGTAAGLTAFAVLASTSGAWAYAGPVAAAAGQLYVLADIVSLAIASRRGPTGDEAAVDRLVKHNPVHFAVLGVSLALACGLVL